MAKIKVVHYINQFFAGIGGEEKADIPAELHKGEAIGPGMAFNTGFGDEAEIVATIVCGDSYFNENIDAVNPTGQTLPSHNVKFYFSNVQPTSMLRCVVYFESVCKGSCILRRECRTQDNVRSAASLSVLPNHERFFSLGRRHISNLPKVR